MAIAFVDGTKARSFRPGDPIAQELRHDGYHHIHAHSVLVWCDIFGDFIRLDNTLNEVDHDRMIFNNSASCLQPELHFTDGECVMADSGFRGDGPMCFLLRRIKV
jgi:DDE superfamily endonuclease